jgi:GNAT superfamily N-acetyltransferase
MQEVIIRPGRASDVAQVMGLVHELAHFEKAPQEVTNTEERMAADGFGADPQFLLWVLEIDAHIVGMAICYTRYSTWKGTMLYLEDFYIQPAFRGAGYGDRLFATCLEYGRQRGFAGMCWQVLDWNSPAIAFYEKRGALLDASWVNGKIMY